MSPCVIQQSCWTTREEIWTGSINPNGAVVCPKPLRLSLVRTMPDSSPATPFRWLVSHKQENCETNAANELLDIILSKDVSSDSDQFSRDISPPSRVSNPLIQDARFVKEKFIPRVVPVRGDKPTVRIEGFDCLNRDNRRNCSIPALA